MNNLKTSAVPSSARRRLVSGAFGMPAVLALHSGSALAAASNVRCVNNQADGPVPPGVTGAPDQYVRVQLYGKKDAAGNVVEWWLSGASVDAVRFGYAKARNLFLDANRWRRLYLHDNGSVQLGTAVLAAQPEGTTPQPRWVALRFVVANGNRVEIRGVIDGTSVGSAVTGSCWSSFVGLTNP